ncbi:unnamed protein product [marine sediment metagenome]|uniref:Uncharacterized protein n=1 Tax=marine sediment metagenome TaxID=412755 RepID=X0X4S4_9ZZZZ
MYKSNVVEKRHVDILNAKISHSKRTLLSHVLRWLLFAVFLVGCIYIPKAFYFIGGLF